VKEFRSHPQLFIEILSFAEIIFHFLFFSYKRKGESGLRRNVTVAIHRQKLGVQIPPRPFWLMRTRHQYPTSVALTVARATAHAISMRNPLIVSSLLFLCKMKN